MPLVRVDIQQNPDPKYRQEASREAMERVWNGYDGDENRIPLSVFEPEW